VERFKFAAMSNPILVLGAGRSATVLLDYLNDLAQKGNFRFTIADADEKNLSSKTSELPHADGLIFKGSEVSDFASLIGNHKIVISLLPPPLHPKVGKACLETRSHLITASYESPEMREMSKEISEKGLIFMNECGLDPGIDHMSAMEIIHDIQSKGGKITKFTSFTGGLVADEFDDNPFKYKISWNPRNVVLAGKGVAKFLQNGNVSLIPYHRLFDEYETISVKGWGEFEGYANRDSTPYAELYGLEGIKTLKRGTFRKKGFCDRWNVMVQLGLTDDDTNLTFSEGATYSDLMEAFLPGFKTGQFEALSAFCGNEKIASDILDLGFGGPKTEKLDRTNGKPADYLLDLIVKKWVLLPNDKDLVVMNHCFEYKLEDSDYQTVSSFGMVGDNSIRTAMAKTVGLPPGIVAKQILNNQFKQKGLLLPLQQEIYSPVLKELAHFGVSFFTTTRPLS